MGTLPLRLEGLEDINLGRWSGGSRMDRKDRVGCLENRHHAVLACFNPKQLQDYHVGKGLK